MLLVEGARLARSAPRAMLGSQRHIASPKVGKRDQGDCAGQRSHRRTARAVGKADDYQRKHGEIC